MKDFIAPITAMGIVFAGGAFLYLTLGLDGSRVESVHLIISGLMGGAAHYLFGADIQQRANSAVPTITTTSAGPPRTTTTVDPSEPYPDDRHDLR